MKVHVKQNPFGPERDAEIIETWDSNKNIIRYVAVDMRTAELCIIYKRYDGWYHSYQNELMFPIR